MDKKRIHVLYYVPGKNMMGLQRLMSNLRQLWGKNIIALPKDLTKLAQNEMSVNELIGIRNMLNGIIMSHQRELGVIPQPPQNVQRQQPNGNMMPGGGYQPQNAPQRPPAPPTSGSNAVKPQGAPRVTARGFIKEPFEAPPVPQKISKN
jgi:hypothetical protein